MRTEVFHQAGFILVPSDVKKNTRFIQYARKKVIFNPQHLQVVILECAVKGILPIGLMWCASITKDAQPVCDGATEVRHRGA